MQFNKTIEKNVHNYSVSKRNESIAMNKKVDTVMSIISIGALAYSLTTPSIPNTQNINHSGSEWFKNGMDWNPLNLNQFPL
jgi:hypothetical protein